MSIINSIILNISSQNLILQALNIIAGNNLLKGIFISALVGLSVGLIKKTVHIAFKVAFIIAVLYVCMTLITNNM